MEVSVKMHFDFLDAQSSPALDRAGLGSTRDPLIVVIRILSLTSL
jgi:hypothetical protein